MKELEEIYGSPNPFKGDKDYDRAVAINTVLNELDKKDKIINLLLTEITAVNSGRYEYMYNDEVLEIFTKKAEGKI